jgi:hypothetical protein
VASFFLLRDVAGIASLTSRSLSPIIFATVASLSFLHPSDCLHPKGRLSPFQLS